MFQFLKEVKSSKLSNLEIPDSMNFWVLGLQNSWTIEENEQDLKTPKGSIWILEIAFLFLHSLCDPIEPKEEKWTILYSHSLSLTWPLGFPMTILAPVLNMLPSYHIHSDSKLERF